MLSRGMQSSEFVLALVALLSVVALSAAGEISGGEVIGLIKWLVPAYIAGRSTLKIFHGENGPVDDYSGD